MQPLKVLVIAMGLLILVGLGIVAMTIVERLGRRPGGFGAANLVLPKGCHVIGMTSAGAKLAVRLGDTPECQIVLIVDPESGQETGRIALAAEP